MAPFSIVKTKVKKHIYSGINDTANKISKKHRTVRSEENIILSIIHNPNTACNCYRFCTTKKVYIVFGLLQYTKHQTKLNLESLF